MSSVIIKAACVVAVILSSPWIACSQHYYVVVGAFTAEEKAGEFKGSFPAQLLDSAFTDVEKESLLHFYVLKTSDKQSAISKTQQLKKGIESLNASGDKSADEVKAPLHETAGETVASGTEQHSENAVEEKPTAGEGSASASASARSGAAGNIPAPPVGKYFKFQIEAPEGGPVPTQVHHVDFERELELATYKTNTFVDLLRPGHTDKPMAIVCGAFGYKEIQKYIDYSNPSATDKQAYLDAQGVWVIPYKLERVEAGDVSLMYNVSFYKDAVVMRKTSERDLDELVNMMHRNPYYKITIHAHCNGKKKREIIALGSDKNYFDVAGSVEITGSAKDLTQLRADAIRSYLIEHGIDAGRIDTFSWGGSDMLVKADDPQAELNDRIEIEFRD